MSPTLHEDGFAADGLLCHEVREVTENRVEFEPLAGFAARLADSVYMDNQSDERDA